MIEFLDSVRSINAVGGDWAVGGHWGDLKVGGEVALEDWKVEGELVAKRIAEKEHRGSIPLDSKRNTQDL